MPFIPFHLYFLALLIVNQLTGIGAHCPHSNVFPLMLFLMEIGFIAILVTIWALHSLNWLNEWKPETMDERQILLNDMFR